MHVFVLIILCENKFAEFCDNIAKEMCSCMCIGQDKRLVKVQREEEEEEEEAQRKTSN